MRPIQSHGRTATVHNSEDQLLLLAGIIRGIYVVELYWRRTMNLDCRFPAHHGVVVHAGIQKGEAAGGKLIILLSSNLSPMPTLIVPAITVTFSRRGCQ